MLSLCRKELRSILPFLALVTFVGLMGLVYELWTGPPNRMPLAKSYQEYVVSSKEGQIVIFLVTFALASGLLVREYDEGTMEFLDSLPVSRTRVFCVKVTAACFVLLVLILADISVAVVLHALSRTSLDRSFHVPVLATAAMLRFCQLFVVLALGLALSFLRRFGWLVAALLFWFYILLHEYVPQMAIFDLFALTQPRFEGQRWIVPRQQLAVQLALAVVFLAVAYGLFLGWGDQLIRGFQSLIRTRWGNGVLLTGAISVGILVSGLVVRYMVKEYGDDPADESDVTITYPSWNTSRLHTDHYLFIYPTNLSARARELATRADAVFETVGTFLEAESMDSILVDAASLLPRHAGLAYWDKIRLDLSSSDDIETLRSILGHETTHVVLDRVSDARLQEQLNSTRFFHEGVASYVEYHLFESEQPVDVLRSVAAVMHERGEVKFAELVDNEELCARRDTNLVYPLGEVFVEALISRYGRAAVPRIVRALVRDDAPDHLRGLDLWRDVFQASGYNLDDVLDEFFAMLDAEVVRHRRLIDRLPRMRGAFDQDNDWVYVQILGEPIEGWSPVCRFRQAVDSADRFYFAGLCNEPRLFYQNRDLFRGASVWYQLGLSDGKGRVIYEPWLEVTLDYD